VANKFPSSGRSRSALPDAQPSARVLVVDDDYQVRQITRMMLEAAGYEVLQARDSADAMRVVAAASPTVDLALLDINLPAMDGRHLAVRITNASPQTKILYMSGVPAESLSEYGIVADSWFIQKPFASRELLARVVDRLG
jgi:DNA-binding response OmpR family regulator